MTVFLNQTQLDILAQPSYRRLLRGEMILRTFPGQSQYGLPAFASRIVAIIDPARQWRLDPMSVDAYRRYVPNPRTYTGNPERYAFDGWSSTMRQPLSGGLLYVFSRVATAPTTMLITGTSIADAFAPGIPLGSYTQNTVSAVLDNTAPFPGVVISGTNELTSVFDVKLTDPVPPDGLVSLVEADPAKTPIAQIIPGQRRSRSPQIYLAPTPSGVFDFVAYYEREPPAVTVSTDEPILPTRFHHLLSTGARMKEYELRGDTTRYAIAKREYDTGLLFLNTWIADQPDAGDQMHPDDRHGPRSSVLGPWFPASGYR
jgi:hypothetical protein